MNYRDLEKRIREIDAEQQIIRSMGDRRYLHLDDEAIHRSTAPVEFWFYVSSWGDEDSAPVVAVSTNYSGSDIGRFGARTLRRVAAVKQLYEDWFAGKISEVPIDLPAEIANLP